MAGIAAVVLRHEVKTPAELLNLGLSEAAVDKALEELSAGAYLHDSQFPFMQRPAVNTSNPKDKATYVGPGTHPVKKLSPAMPPNESEDFANLLTASQERLSLEDAVMWLVTYHHLSVAGNNAYCGDKCVSGSPAMRFVGTENSATEVLWHGQSLLETLLMAIPQSWVKGTGLPAWADRTCAYSRHDGIVHPLWSATWTSNSLLPPGKHQSLLVSAPAVYRLNGSLPRWAAKISKKIGGRCAIKKTRSTCTSIMAKS